MHLKRYVQLVGLQVQPIQVVIGIVIEVVRDIVQSVVVDHHEVDLHINRQLHIIDIEDLHPKRNHIKLHLDISHHEVEAFIEGAQNQRQVNMIDHQNDVVAEIVRVEVQVDVAQVNEQAAPDDEPVQGDIALIESIVRVVVVEDQALQVDVNMNGTESVTEDIILIKDVIIVVGEVLIDVPVLEDITLHLETNYPL